MIRLSAYNSFGEVTETNEGCPQFKIPVSIIKLDFYPALPVDSRDLLTELLRHSQL